MNSVIQWFNDKTEKYHQAIAEIDNDYRPNSSEEYMCSKHREYFRRKLLAWKLALVYHFDNTRKSISETEWNHTSIDDRVMSEMGLQVDMRACSRRIKLIERIDAALERIISNQYGYCVITDEPIGLKRLEARPIATMCIQAQEEHERFERGHNRDAQHQYVGIEVNEDKEVAEA